MPEPTPRPSTPRAQKLRLAAAALCTVAILVMCLWPRPDIGRLARVPSSDKIVHLTAFLVQAFVCRWAALGVAASLALGAALAVGTEYLQANLHALGRTGEVADAVADGLGVLFGLLAWRLVGARVERAAP